MNPRRMFSAFCSLAALSLAFVLGGVAPAGALPGPMPLTGTVAAVDAHRTSATGPIFTDVTLVTSAGTVVFTMEGGVIDGIGMLTGEYAELRVADAVVVWVTEGAAGLLEAVDAPIVLSAHGGMTALAVTDYVYDGHRWDHGDLPLSWRFNTGSAPAGALAAVQAAANTWEADPGSAIDFTYAGTTSAVPGAADDINTVGWRQNTAGGQLASCVIWFYPTRESLGYNRIIEFDIDFNRAYSWSTSGSGGSFDIQSVALHEFGHSLHLGDLHNATPTSAQEVMNGYIGGGEILRVLGAGDLAGANAIYPDGGGGVSPPPPPPPPPPGDTAPPVSTASVSPTGWTRGPVSFSMSAADSGSGVAAMYYRTPGSSEQTYSSPVSFDAEGVVPVTYWAVDDAGNVESPRAVEARIDRTSPTVTSDAGGGYVGEAVVRLWASDGLSGVARMTYRIDGGAPVNVSGWSAVVTVATPGDHTIEYSATDAAGNTASAITRVSVTQRDVAAPVTTALGTASEWSSGTVMVTLATADEDVAATYYRIGEGPDTRYTAPFEVWTEGETNLRFWSTDSAGNTEAPRTAIVRIDRTQPVVACSPEAVYRSSAEIPIDASDAHSGIGQVLWRVDGGAWRSLAAPGASILVTAPGTHALDYVAVDAAGNERGGSATFAVLTPATITGKPGTALSLKRRRGSAAVTLSAIARRSDGTRIPRAAVTLQRSTNGRTWTTVARVVASSSGSVSKRLTFKKAGTTYWRWRIGTDHTRGHEAATSRALRVRVK